MGEACMEVMKYAYKILVSEPERKRARGRLGINTSVNTKVSGLATWSENCKWYSSLPLSAVVTLFSESVYRVLPAITLCFASQRVFIVVSVYFVIDSVWKRLDTPPYEDDNRMDFKNRVGKCRLDSYGPE
jgi:hypothetical protein